MIPFNNKNRVAANDHPMLPWASRLPDVNFAPYILATPHPWAHFSQPLRQKESTHLDEGEIALFRQILI